MDRSYLKELVVPYGTFAYVFVQRFKMQKICKKFVPYFATILSLGGNGFLTYPQKKITKNDGI